MGRMAADWDGEALPPVTVAEPEPDPNEELAYIEEEVDVLALADTGYLAGGDRYSYYAHYDTAEEAERAHISKLFRCDEKEQWPSAAAMRFLQPTLRPQGHGSSRNQRRRRATKAEERREMQRLADLNEPIVSLSRIIARCLSPGEWAYYYRRTGEDERVLNQYALRLQTQGAPIMQGGDIRSLTSRAFSLVVYVEPVVAQVLHADRGSIRRVLAAHARERAPEFVAAFDFGWQDRRKRAVDETIPQVV
jgi:hypothetical protein